MPTIDTTATGTRYVQKGAIAQRFHVAVKTIERDIHLLKEIGAPGFAELSLTNAEIDRERAYWIAYVRLLRTPPSGRGLRGQELDDRLFEAALTVQGQQTIEDLIEERPYGRDFLQNPGF